MNNNDKNRKPLAIIILVLLVVLAVATYFFVSKKQAFVPTDTNVTPNTKDSLVIKTYSNDEYGFSIEYPCNGRCQAIPPVPRDNVYGEGEIGFYVVDNAYMTIDGFTDEKVEAWNSSPDVTAGPGSPLTLSLSSLREALTLPIGSKCKIASPDWIYGKSYTFNNCKVVLIGGEKAVEVVDAVFKGTYPNRSYFIDRGGNRWVEITELFAADTSDFLTDPSKITHGLQAQMDGMAGVLKTVKFY